MSEVATLNVVKTVTRPGVLRWRVRVLAEDYPTMPDEDMGAPIWEIARNRMRGNPPWMVWHSHIGLVRGEESELVNAEVLSKARDQFGNDQNGRAKMLRWLRMFRGVTTAEIVADANGEYLICDTPEWRVSVGYSADSPSKIAMDVAIWKSWLAGEVYRLELQYLPLTVNPWNATDANWVSGGTMEPLGEYPFFGTGVLSDVVYGMTDAVKAATEVLGDDFRLTPPPPVDTAPAGFRHVEAVHLRPGMVCDLSGDRYADDSTIGQPSIYLFECVEVTAVGLVAVGDDTNAVEVCFVGAGGDNVVRFPHDWTIKVRTQKTPTV